MKDELVSVIIPIYNIEVYIKRCVNSIINQTYKNIEILLIDDGATDNSGKICDELAKQDSRIKVFHKVNGGLSDARNYGIEKSKGKYITTIDGDDFVSEDYVEHLYRLLIDNNADISSTNRNMLYEDMYNGVIEKAELFNNYPVTKVFSSFDYLKELLSSKLPHEAWAKLYKKEIFEKEKYTKGLKVFEDLEFIVRVLQNNQLKIACNTSMFDYYYRMRDTSIMNEKYNDYWEKELIFYVSLLHSEALKDCYGIVSSLLTIMCRRNINKILAENEPYYRFKNIQPIAREVKLKYYKNYKDRMKMLILRFFPLLLFIFLKINRRDKEKIKFEKRFNKYLQVCRKNNEQLHLIFNGPKTGNLGDYAILFAEEKKLDMEGKRHFSISSKEFVYFFADDLYKKVSKEDIIYITGGGNTGTLWRQEQTRINKVLDVFKDNKIIIFPQTIYYADDEFGQECFEKDLKFYQKCSNLEFQCRDKKTFDFVTQRINIPAVLTKDIALSLDYRHFNYNRSGIIFCFRNDLEMNIQENQRKMIIDMIEKKYQDEKFEFIDTVLKEKEEYTYEEAKKEFNQMIKKFASSKLIITDRLHGMIFATITDTPCIAINNLSGKVKGVYDTIKEESSNIIFIENNEIGDQLWKRLKDL
ncbi:MAG: glycosyltransferase [Clostridia bacterium]|nr:glycosyltransferase [Clostridia bacterium]